MCATHTHIHTSGERGTVGTNGMGHIMIRLLFIRKLIRLCQKTWVAQGTSSKTTFKVPVDSKSVLCE